MSYSIDYFRLADDAVKKACAFLCSIQRDDGGWGEAFEVEKTYRHYRKLDGFL